MTDRRGAWPYPGDGPLIRARRVAHAYRARLHAVDQATCEELDEVMRRWGQHWAVPIVLTVDPDDWLGPRQAADIGLVSQATLRTWRTRGRLHGRKTIGPNGGVRFEYRARDVLALAAQSRRRKQRSDNDDTEVDTGDRQRGHGGDGG